MGRGAAAGPGRQSWHGDNGHLHCTGLLSDLTPIACMSCSRLGISSPAAELTGLAKPHLLLPAHCCTHSRDSAVWEAPSLPATLPPSRQGQQQEQHPARLCITAVTPSNRAQSQHLFTVSRAAAASRFPGLSPPHWELRNSAFPSVALPYAAT